MYKTFKYKVCPHCDKELNLKIFREHKRLYYDSSIRKSGVGKKCSIRSSDESEPSGFEFEGIDRSETVIANEKELDLGECFADEGMNMKPVIHLSTSVGLVIRLAIDQGVLVLPGSSEPKFHFFVRVTWPMIHPNQFDVGKPFEVWFDNLDEPDSRNSLRPI